jgi:hypothetical protein
MNQFCAAGILSVIGMAGAAMARGWCRLGARANPSLCSCQRLVVSVYLGGKSVPWDEKTGSMPSQNYSRPRPSWRLSHSLNQQEVRIWPRDLPKKKNYYVRSWNVYENNQNKGKMPGAMSGICARSKLILQKIPHSIGQFALIYGFGTCFLTEFLQPENLSCAFAAWRKNPPAGRTPFGPTPGAAGQIKFMFRSETADSRCGELCAPAPAAPPISDIGRIDPWDEAFPPLGKPHVDNRQSQIGNYAMAR